MQDMAEGTVAADQLRLFIERIERLEEEKKGIADDIRDVYSEAKANGYDTKTMRMIVRLRKMETHTRQEQDALLETYRQALGLALRRRDHGRPFQIKNIMHRKGAQDKKRSAMFSKLSREITVAAKMGLPDPDMNARLRAAVLAAKAQSMPKDNIQRSIDKASGGDAENYEEIRYEGFGPGGVALIVEALTDNRNRTATNVRTAFSKNGGNLGASGQRQPRLRAHGPDRISGARAGDADKVLEAAIEAGADDVESDEDGHRIWTSIDSLHEVAKALEPLLGEGEGAKLAWKPATEVEVRGDDAATLMKLIDTLEDDDDVQTVWGNYDDPRRGAGEAWPDQDPRPRPGPRHHRLGPDPGRGQPPEPRRQRPVQDRAADAACRTPGAARRASSKR